MSQLRNSNLLYRPSLSIWTARKKDKSESAKVNEQAGAVAGAANVNKQLFPEWPDLLAIQKWASGFRNWVYEATLPWDDSGWRIGRIEKHLEFTAAAAAKIREAEILLDTLIANYPAAVEQARFKLANMFDPSDYPTVNEVRRKFAFSLECQMLPNVEDFRIIDGIPADEVEALVQAAETNTEQRLGAAMTMAYERLHEVVTKMYTTLEAFGDKKIRKFNDTLLSNVVTLVDLMPALNLTGDPKLAALADKAKALTAYDLKDLRKDDAVRAAAIKEAQQLAQMFGVTDRSPAASPLLEAPYEGKTVQPGDAYAAVAAGLGAPREEVKADMLAASYGGAAVTQEFSEQLAAATEPVDAAPSSTEPPSAAALFADGWGE